MHMAIFWALLVVGIWLGAWALRSRGQAERRRWGHPPLSLGAELCRLLVLLLPWGLFLAIGAYAIQRSCYEDEGPFIDLAPGVSVDEYCTAALRERFPGTLVAVSVLFAGVALVWTVSVLLFRASERRRALVG
jgi:hypothetical protein